MEEHTTGWVDDTLSRLRRRRAVFKFFIAVCGVCSVPFQSRGAVQSLLFAESKGGEEKGNFKLTTTLRRQRKKGGRTHEPTKTKQQCGDFLVHEQINHAGRVALAKEPQDLSPWGPFHPGLRRPRRENRKEAELLEEEEERSISRGGAGCPIAFSFRTERKNTEILLRL